MSTTRSPEKTDFLASVLVTAVEGGSGYWSRAYGYKWAGLEPGSSLLTEASVTLVDHLDAVDRADLDLTWSYQPLDDLVEAKDERLAPITWKVDVDTIASAFAKIRKGTVEEASKTFKVHESYIERLREAYRENEAGDIDSTDADIVVQIATLGEVVYG